jgi:epoxyqueuosine reductase
MNTLAERLKDHARRLGFDLVGIAPATEPPGAESLRDWLAKGYAGEMRYMNRQETARQHPQSILPEVRSIVMVAMVYRQPAMGNRQQDALTGRVSCYAQGTDYHDVMWRRVEELLAWVRQQEPECQGRAVVDTAPLLERDFARLAGLGWFGKNTMLLHKRLGSYFFLGALLLSLPLPADAPFETAHCGTCTACLDACPTQAFVGPGQLDARRCISYLTIELRRPIPQELRRPMGDWVFGCDICQDVCPWNRKAPVATESEFQSRDDLAAPDLLVLLRLSAIEFRRRFRGTAIKRTKRRGLLRNAAIALGNRGDLRAVPALIEALQDEEPLIRGAAAWALGELHSDAARDALSMRQRIEKDDSVRQEIALALGSVGPAVTSPIRDQRRTLTNTAKSTSSAQT